MTRSFAVTWDYRCPFARNANEHLLDGLAAGADWEVTFSPFSLGQVHVAEGEPDVWDAPDKDTGLIALQAGVVVRDSFPDQFRALHRSLFAARHDQGLQLRDRGVVRAVLEANGLPADDVFAAVDDGTVLKQVRSEHEAMAEHFHVWGVPTFVMSGEAAFARLMTRPAGDAKTAVRTIERVLDLLEGFPALNEFKHTAIDR